METQKILLSLKDEKNELNQLLSTILDVDFKNLDESIRQTLINIYINYDVLKNTYKKNETELYEWFIENVKNGNSYIVEILLQNKKINHIRDNNKAFKEGLKEIQTQIKIFYKGKTRLLQFSKQTSKI